MRVGAAKIDLARKDWQIRPKRRLQLLVQLAELTVSSGKECVGLHLQLNPYLACVMQTQMLTAGDCGDQ